MKNAKLKTLLLGTMVAIYGAWGLKSCSDSNNQKVGKKPQTEVSKPQTHDSTIEDRKIAMFNQTRDYMRRINGYNEYMAQLDSMRPVWQDQEDIDFIKNAYSLGGTMTRRVSQSGTQIIDQAYADIVAQLGKYKLTLDDKVFSEGKELNIINKQDTEDEEVFYHYKPCMAFVGVGNGMYDDMEPEFWVLYETDGAFNHLTNAIYEVIEESDYDLKTQIKIKEEIYKIIVKTKNDLQKNRKKIEQEYKDYYFVDDFGKQTLGIGSYSFGYDALNDESLNGKYAITRRYTSLEMPDVYREFLSDTAAKYELIDLGSDKWQISKSTADGKRSFTKVFNCKAHQSDVTSVSSEPAGCRETGFESEYDESFGLRVYSEKVINVSMRTKEWVPQIPVKQQQTMDSLEKEVTKKLRVENEFERKKREADSVASMVVHNKFENQK